MKKISKKNKRIGLGVGCFILLAIFMSDDVMMNFIKIDPVFKTQGELTVFVTTDTHYLAPKLTDDGTAFQTFYESGYGAQYKYSDELLNTLIMDIESTNPDILIISGDLTANGEYESHVELASKLKTIEMLGTTVYVIPGNHDLNNPYARGFNGDNQYVVDSIDEKSFVNLYQDFGYNEAISKDKDTLSYLVAPKSDVWFLMLDTTLSEKNIRKGKPEVEGDVSFESWEWMRDCYELANRRNAKIVPVMHHSLIDHSSFFTDGYTLKNPKEVATLLRKLGSSITLTGHIHSQDIASTIIENQKLYDIATNSLLAFPNQYGILSVNPDSGYRYQTKELAVEEWAKQNNSQNDELLNFEEYAKEFFETSISSTLKQKLLTKGYSWEVVDEMIAAMVKTNMYYSSGRENEIAQEVKESKGYELWQQMGGYWKDFISTAVDDSNEDDNELMIDE